MKRKVRNTAMLVLVLCMLFSMFVVNVSAADEPESVVDDCERVVKAYDYDVAIGYINDKDETTYPKMDNYLFAGWYTDADCTTEYWGKATPGETVYALFVPSHILSVKAQISANLLSGSADKSQAAIRFVTTVDTLLYTQVGFDISYLKNGTTKAITKSSNTVYEQLYAVGKSSEKETYTENGVIYRPWSSFCKLSTYFKACTISKIPTETNYETQFTVKPFWYTIDGSKVYGETAVKSISEYFDAEDVYVSANGNDETGTGTSESPFATLNTAIANVKNGGTVHIVGDVTVAADATWETHGKSVTITNNGDSTTDTLTFAATTVDVKDSVKFTSLELNFPAPTTDTDGTVNYTKIFAWGNTFEIASDVTGLENYVYVYGGGSEAITSDTNLILRAGNYQRIFGGGTAAVTGNTHVTLSGTINADIDYKVHGFSAGCLVFGGGQSAVVTGDTNVTILDSTVYFNYIYGGGCYSTAKITGNCNVNYAGSAMSVYGGGFNGYVTGNTNVTMTGGWVEQIFGGCEGASMKGNTDVQVLGGTVKRRIFGGCYNDHEKNTTFHVDGYTMVSIDKNVTLEQSDSLDNSIIALSRNLSSVQEAERGVFIFNDYDNNPNDEKVGTNKAFSYIIEQAYNYLVKATSGGTVYAEGEQLRIVPETGKKATVRKGSTTGDIVFYTESEGICTLPKLTSATEKMEFYVEFTSDKPDGANTSNCEARINGAYYNTLEEAIAAVSTADPTTITLLQESIEVESVSTIVENKNILINVDKSLRGKTVTINRKTDFGSMFVVDAAGKLTIQDVVLDGRITAELGQTTDLTTGSNVLIICNGTLNLDDTTIQYAINSSDTGGAIYLNSNSAVANLTGTSGRDMAKIENCSAQRGGAIFIKTGKVNATNYAFNNNKATNTKDSTGNNTNEKGGGGAILDNSAGSRYTSCTFLGNESGLSGGAYKVHSSSATPVFTKCKFIDNKATNDGGGIYVVANANGSVSIVGTTFSGNQSGATGGAINIASGATVTCENAIFSGNKGHTGTAYTNGGAVYCAGIFKDTNSSYIGNEARNGGAIFVPAGGSVTLTGNDTTKAFFRENQAKGNTNSRGGAIFSNYSGTTGGSVSVTGYIFEGNGGASTDYPDSVVHIMNYCNATLIDVTLQGETTQKIYVLGTLTYNNLPDGVIVDGNDSDSNLIFVEASITESDGSVTYYKTLEEAIAAVSTTEQTTISLLQETIEVDDKLSISSTQNILIKADESLKDETVTICRSSKSINMFDVATSGTLTIQGIVLDGRITTELKQTTDLTTGSTYLIICKGILNLYDTTIQYAINSNDYSGAIYLNSANAVVNLTGTSGSSMAKIENCSAKRGGAIFIGTGKVNATNYAFNNNKATGDGGAILDNSSGSTYTNCTFSNNESGANGGAYKVHKATSNPLFKACVFNNNNANTGSAIYVNSSENTTLINAVFQGEIAQKVYVAATRNLYFNNITGAVLVAGADTSSFVVSGYQDGNVIEYIPYEYTDGIQVLNKADELDETVFQAACSAIAVPCSSDGKYWSIGVDGKLVDNTVASITTDEETQYFTNLVKVEEYISKTEAETIEIVILKDAFIDETFEVTKNMSIINAPGKSVTIRRGTQTAYDMFEVAADATLTLGTSATDETGKLIIDGATTSAIEGRTVTVNAGAGFVLAKNATLQNANCTSKVGAAVYTESTNTTIYGTIKDNVTTNNGGGLYVDINAGATIEGATFSGNHGGAAAGGLYIAAGATVECENATFFGNKGLKGTTYANGGAVYCAGTFDDTNSSYTGNEAKNGGAIIVMSGGSVTLIGTDTTKALIKNNQGASNGTGGGAIYLNKGTLEITGYTFEGNTSEGKVDSAIYVVASQTANLKDVIFQGTTIQKVYVAGTLTYSNVTWGDYAEYITTGSGTVTESTTN